MKTRLLLRRKSLVIAIGVSVVLCATAAAFGTKNSGTIQFMVIDGNGRPVKNAEIVIHTVDRKGAQRDAGVELKTHDDGKAAVNGIPYGKLRVQVISPGFKTFGKDYDLGQPSMELTVKLQKADAGYVVK